jgi:signal transduction histidine kinase
MSEEAPPAGQWRAGLSFRLLLLTALVVLFVEALIYLPGIASYRNGWLGERLSQARTLATLIENSPPDSLPRAVIEEVLDAAEISAIALRIENTRRLIASVETPRMVSYEIDLRWPSIMRDIWSTFDILLRGNGRMLRVIGPPPRGGDFVEIVLHEAPLRKALLSFSWMILRDSLLISLFTALVIYAALSGLIVAPVRRLARSVSHFRESPDDARSLVGESGRSDELGHLERNIARMQLSLRAELRQREHLAQLGLAVAKINHDLRNMLSSAQLMADRLGTLEDPTVQRLVPRLMAALDRAILFCQSALAYGRAEERPPELVPLAVAPFFADLAAQMQLDASTSPALVIKAEPGLRVLADAEHLNRVLTNLIRNAQAALAGQASPPPGITLEARHVAATRQVTIAVQDNGPGIPPAVQEKLFQAFAGSARAGGTGLGLAIASELVRGMGGSLRLQTPVAGGACFLLLLAQG